MGKLVDSLPEESRLAINHVLKNRIVNACLNCGSLPPEVQWAVDLFLNFWDKDEIAPVANRLDGEAHCLDGFMSGGGPKEEAQARKLRQLARDLRKLTAENKT